MIFHKELHSEKLEPLVNKELMCALSMVIVQGKEKRPQMETCADFGDTFVQCIDTIM